MCRIRTNAEDYFFFSLTVCRFRKKQCNGKALKYGPLQYITNEKGDTNLLTLSFYCQADKELKYSDTVPPVTDRAEEQRKSNVKVNKIHKRDDFLRFLYLPPPHNRTKKEDRAKTGEASLAKLPLSESNGSRSLDCLFSYIYAVKVFGFILFYHRRMDYWYIENRNNRSAALEIFKS